MIINLTSAFDFIHDLWDVFGAMIGISLCVFLPIIVVLASVMKIKEKLNSDKDLI
jgi:hypothetical protein